jgi:hypothetical protein
MPEIDDLKGGEYRGAGADGWGMQVLYQKPGCGGFCGDLEWPIY